MTRANAACMGQRLCEMSAAFNAKCALGWSFSLNSEFKVHGFVIVVS